MAKRKKKKSIGWRGQVLLIGALISCVVFSALSMLLFVGMIPTVVASLADRSQYRLRTWTVGAMNLAGCVPFMLEIWRKGSTIDVSLSYITQPRTIVVIYFAAAMGYVIDWAVTSLVASVMVQRGKGRQKEIEKLQTELVDRWGPEITGKIALDEYGFPKQDTEIDESGSVVSAVKSGD